MSSLPSSARDVRKGRRIHEAGLKGRGANSGPSPGDTLSRQHEPLVQETGQRLAQTRCWESRWERLRTACFRLLDTRGGDGEQISGVGEGLRTKGWWREFWGR